MPRVYRDGAVVEVDWSKLTPQEREVRREIDVTNEHIASERKLRGQIPLAANRSVPRVPSLPAATSRRPGRPRRPRVVDDPFLQAEWAMVAKPPLGNTGADSTEPGLFKPSTTKIDWLNVSFPYEKMEAVRERVSRTLGGAQDRLFGAMFQRLSAQWESKALLAWSEGNGYAVLSLNGDSVDRFSAEEQLDLLRWLKAIGAKCTRLDLAFDDYLRIVPIDVVVANAKAGNLVHFRAIDPRQPIDALSGEKKGDGIYFGSPGRDGSGKYMRLYDKLLESGDPNQDCNRWELVLSQGYAVDAFDKLCECTSTDALSRTIGSVIGGAIDFRMREGYEHHISRAPRLCWWERILQILGQSVLC